MSWPGQSSGGATARQQIPALLRAWEERHGGQSFWNASVTEKLAFADQIEAALSPDPKRGTRQDKQGWQAALADFRRACRSHQGGPR